MSDINKIAELISKGILFGNKSDEYRKLDSWIRDSEDNKDRYQDIKEGLNDYISERENLKVSDSWDLFKSKIEQPKINYFETVWFKSAAVIIILFSLSVGFYFINSYKHSHYEIADNNSVRTEKPSVRLITENGNDLNLLDLKDTSCLSNENLAVDKDSFLLICKTGSVTGKSKINKLVVPRGAEYNLVLSDGTVVFLNSDSNIEFPTEFGKDKRMVKLSGEAFFRVKKNLKKPFIVKAGDVKVEVTGTKFNLKAYQDDDFIQTTLVEGGVNVFCKGRGRKPQKITLTPSYQAEFSKMNDLMTVKKVDTELFTSWKDKYFVFKNQKLEYIMKVLSRWYGVDIFYQNNEIRDIEFAGKLKRYDEIDKILEIIENTNSLNIEKNGNAVIFKKK